MENKLIITRGLPASGKSTFAKAWVLEDPKNRIRVNRDDIRWMLGPYWVPSREDLVTRIENMMVQSAFSSGYSVIVDATNFRKTERFVNMMPSDYTVEVKDFTDVPIEECIRRDSTRDEGCVGEEVIRGMYDKYLKK